MAGATEARPLVVPMESDDERQMSENNASSMRRSYKHQNNGGGGGKGNNNNNNGNNSNNSNKNNNKNNNKRPPGGETSKTLEERFAKCGNDYARKKVFAQSLLDVALLSANTRDLRHIVNTWRYDKRNGYEFGPSNVAVFIMISASIICQVVAGLAAMFLDTAPTETPAAAAESSAQQHHQSQKKGPPQTDGLAAPTSTSAGNNTGNAQQSSSSTAGASSGPADGQYQQSSSTAGRRPAVVMDHLRQHLTTVLIYMTCLLNICISAVQQDNSAATHPKMEPMCVNNSVVYVMTY